MSRYVKEFAHATMFAEKYVKRCPEAGKINKEIENILNVHSKGLITDFEAVELIVKSKRQFEGRE